MTELDKLCINTLRFLAVDAVQQANSGHPGMPMGAAPMAYVLWTRLLRHDPPNPAWPDRDRFVLSAGHGRALLYSLLHLIGYDLTLDELRQFRQWGSRTPGHPERGSRPASRRAPGRSGRGWNAVGMAIAEAWLAATFNRPVTIVDHSHLRARQRRRHDGGGGERGGVAGRHAAARAADRPLRRQPLTLSATTDHLHGGRRRPLRGVRLARPADRRQRPGRDRGGAAAARAVEDRPSLIVVHTHIGSGSPHEAGHVRSARRAARRGRGARDQGAWAGRRSRLPRARRGARVFVAAERGPRRGGLAATVNAYAARIRRGRRIRAPVVGRLPDGWEARCRCSRRDGEMATRDAGGKVLKALAGLVPNLVGGSADLNPSTFTAMKDSGDFETRAAVARTARRAGPAASGATQAATSTSACASTRWPPR